MTNCEKGITVISIKNTIPILNEANVSGFYHDLDFSGSFCPHETGLFRLIYEGSLDEHNENAFSFYMLNNISSKNRTTAYHYLDKNTCYKYQIYHSSFDVFMNGTIYYQKNNDNKTILTSAHSLTCFRDVCLPGSRDLKCMKYITCYKNRKSISLLCSLSLLLLIS